MSINTQPQPLLDVFFSVKSTLNVPNPQETFMLGQVRDEVNERCSKDLGEPTGKLYVLDSNYSQEDRECVDGAVNAVAWEAYREMELGGRVGHGNFNDDYKVKYPVCGFYGSLNPTETQTAAILCMLGEYQELTGYLLANYSDYPEVNQYIIQSNSPRFVERSGRLYTVHQDTSVTPWESDLLWLREQMDACPDTGVFDDGLTTVPGPFDPYAFFYVFPDEPDEISQECDSTQEEVQYDFCVDGVLDRLNTERRQSNYRPACPQEVMNNFQSSPGNTCELLPVEGIGTTHAVNPGFR